MLNPCVECAQSAKCKGITPVTTSKKIAIVGNPNSGKTSLYNVLTNDCQRIGNFPGITVDLKSTTFELHEIRHTLIDLPGVYSLEAFSRDEQVTFNFLKTYHPDLVINVIDASNIERNLYLTAQLSELGLPVIIALNMMDVAHDLGIAINVKELAKRLNVPVIPIVAAHKKGLDELRDAIYMELCAETPSKITLYDMSHELIDDFTAIEKALSQLPDPLPFPSIRWTAVQLTEENETVVHFFERDARPEYQHICKLTHTLYKNLRKHSNESGTEAITEARYAFANGLTHECIKYLKKGQKTITERIDSIVCHRFLGILLMLALVYGIFSFVFAVAQDWTWLPSLCPTPDETWVSPADFIESGFNAISEWVVPYIETPWLNSLVENGVIAGLSGVLTFVPMLFLMFLFIAFFEDSGYIARVSFILDRLLRMFGLQGKSILSFVMAGGLGPGCAVPAVMATRTLRDEKDRLITMFVSPMMICGAKMPILLLLTYTFFPEMPGTMVFILWIVTWVISLIAATVLSKCMFKGETTPFVMELPIYHVPRLRGLLTHAWHNTWLYIQKAGTIILAFNICMWLLMYFPQHHEVESIATTQSLDTTIQSAQLVAKTDSIAENSASVTNDNSAVKQLDRSYAGYIGKALVPVTKYAGMDWRDNIALLGGAAAKEVTFSTLATAYAMSSENEEETEIALRETLHKSPDWNPIRALAFLVFFLFYAPCFATLFAVYKETKSWRWTFFAMAYPTTIAYLLSVAVYQLGTKFFA